MNLKSSETRYRILNELLEVDNDAYDELHLPDFHLKKPFTRFAGYNDAGVDGKIKIIIDTLTDPSYLARSIKHGNVNSFFEAVGLYYSFDNYRPDEMMRVFFKIMDGRDIASGEYDPGGIVNRTTGYFALNEDFEGMENFLVKYANHLWGDEIYLIMCALKRSPHTRLLALQLTGSARDDVCHSQKLGDQGLNIDAIFTKYFAETKMPMRFINFTTVVESILNVKERADPNWFYRTFVSEEPLGFPVEAPCHEYGEKSGRWIDCSTYPAGHRFHKGIPSSSYKVGGRNRHKEAAWLLATNEVNNHFRTHLGLPKIGEGWLGEVSLFNFVRDQYPGELVIHQWRPKWLGRQSLDIGFPELGIGIEFHGTQHYEPVEYFGGEEAFEAQLERDERKAKLCRANDIILLVFNDSHTDAKIQKAVGAAVSKKMKRLKLTESLKKAG